MHHQEGLKYYLEPNDVTDDFIEKRCKSLRHAIRLCRDCSPLTDKEIIDKISQATGYEYQISHFNEALNGGRKNIDPDHIPVLEDVCSNMIPTRYLVLSRHHEMRKKKEAYEIELENVKAELAEKERMIEEERKINQRILSAFQQVRIVG